MLTWSGYLRMRAEPKGRQVVLLQLRTVLIVEAGSPTEHVAH